MSEDLTEYYKLISYNCYASLSVKKLARLFNKADEEERTRIHSYVYNSNRKSNLFKAEFNAIITGIYTGPEALPLEFRRKKRKDLESKTN